MATMAQPVVAQTAWWLRVENPTRGPAAVAWAWWWWNIGWRRPCSSSLLGTNWDELPGILAHEFCERWLMNDSCCSFMMIADA